MAKPFSAKVKLAVDSSDAAHRSFQDHINKFASQHTAPIKLDTSESVIKEYVTNIQSGLNKSTFTISIHEFEIESAKAKLEKDLAEKININIGDNLSESINEIRRALGDLGKDPGAKSLLATINEISLAFEKISKQIEGLTQAMSNMQLNLNLNLGNKGNNPVKNAAMYGDFARKQVLPQIEKEIEAYAKLLREKIPSMPGQNDDLSVILRATRIAEMKGDLDKGYSSRLTRTITDGDYFNIDSSIERKLNSGLEIILSAQKAADSLGEKINNLFPESTEDLVQKAFDIRDGIYKSSDDEINKIKSIFGGGASEEMVNEIKEIISALNEMNGTLKSIANGTVIDSIKQSFDNLAASVANLAKDCISAKESLEQIASGNGTNGLSQDVIRQLNLLKEFKKETNSLYNKTSKIDPNNPELAGISQRYQALIAQIDTARKAADVSGFDSIQNETILLQESINLLLRKIAAEKESEKSAKRRSASVEEETVKYSKILNLYKQIKSYQSKNTKLKVEESAVLDHIAKQLEQNGKISKEDFDQYLKKFQEIQAVVIQQNRAGKSLTTSLSDAFKKFGGWSIVTRSATAIYRTFARIVPTIKELDSAMTELRKVTVASDETYSEFFKNATIRAKEYGATVTDIISATADFARLGYSLTDASTLANAAIVYKNVGDGIENIEVASQSIISTMKAFDIKVEDSMFLVDKFNAVGNNFAISSAGIGDALLNSAASMAAANNTLDETIALITAANTIVQDTSKVGNALKTVSMYLRAAKTEAEEAGESTDGMANSVSELRAELLALTGNKVDIQLDENTFKSTYQILKELSIVWDELTDISKANILESIAGKRQSNIVAAILQEFSIAEEVLGTAANAAGSALRENEEYLNSIQGKLDKFTATFQNLSSTFMSSEFFKGLIESGTSLMDLLTKLLDMMNKIADKFGSSGTLATIAGLTSAGVTGFRGTKQDAQTGLISLLRSGEFSKQKANFDSVLSSDATMRAIERYNSHLEKTVKFKTAYWKALKDSDSELGKYFKTLKGGQASLSGFRNYLIKTEILLKANSIAMKAAAAAATAFDMAINALSGVLATFAIQFAINKILSLISAEKDAAKEAKELADRSREAAIETSSEIKTLDGLIERYEQLGESGSINKESHAEVLDIQQQILDILGAEGGELDLINGKLGEQITKIKELAAAEDGLFSRAKDNALAAYARSVSAVEKAVGSTSGFLGALNYDYSGDRDNKAATILRNAGYWDYVYDGLGKTRILTSGSAEERAEILSGMIKALKDANYDIAESELFAAINEQYNEYVSLIDDQKLAAIDSITQVLNEEFLRKDISGIDINSIESYKELSDELVNIVSNSNDLSTALAKGHISIEDIENAVDSMMKSEYPEWYREVATSAGTFVAHLSSIKDLVDPLTSSYKLMTDALADVHDGGSLSAATLKALAEAEEDYVKYLTFENGQIKLNIDLWRERSKAQIEGNISDAEHEIESLKNRNKQIQDIISSNSKYDGQIMEGVSYEEWSKNLENLTLEFENNSKKIKENYKQLEILKQVSDDVFGPWQDTFSVYDAFATDAANLVRVDEILSNGLTMSTAKARELGDIYPEILAGATEASNGMITLNAAVASDFVEQKHNELKASNEVEISKLEFEATLLAQKIEILKAMRDAVESSNEADVESYANKLAAITAMEEYIRAECEKTGVSNQDATAIAMYAMAGDWESLSTLVDDLSYDMEDDTATAFKNIIINSKQLAEGLITNFNEVGESAKTMYKNISGEDLAEYSTKNLVDNFTANLSSAVADIPDEVQAELNNLSNGIHMFRDGDNVEYINVKIAGESLNKIKSELAPYIEAYKNASKEAIDAEIDSLTDEYDVVMGRIALLRQENEALLNSFKAGTSSKSGIDEYVADIDRFKEALDRLSRARGVVEDLENEFSSLDDTDIENRIKVQEQLIHAYSQEQDAITNLNTIRREAIQESLDALKVAGFDVDYDSTLDRFIVKNREHINELKKTVPGAYDSVQEATNEYRKEMEELIETLESWNEDNKEEFANWLELQHKTHESKVQIVDDLKAMVTQASEATDAIQNVYNTLKSAADEYAQNGGFISVDSFQSIMELGPEYLAYLKDENGQLVINEDRIRDIIKAKKEQLAIDTARSYLGRLEQAMTSGSIEDLEDLIRVTDEATDSEWGLIYAQLAMMGLEGDLHQGALDTINAIRALSNSVGDIFDDTNMSMSDMVDGMNNLIDHVIDMRQHQLDQEVESLEEMKDAFGEIIELRQEALDKAKEENDYQKELTKKVKEIAKLQDRINTLSLDNSRSAQAEKARLEEEMAELQEELAETQADKALEAQKESLDKMQESYEEQKNAEIKTLEESLDSQQEKWDDAISYIENNWGDLHDQLLAWNEEWGSSLNEEITKAFEAAEQMVKRFGGSFRDALAYSKNYEESNSGSSGSSGMSNNTIVGNTVNDSSYTAAQGVSSIIDKMKAEGQKWASTSSQEARDKIMYGKILDLANTLRKEYGIWAYRSGGAWYIDANKIGKTSDTGASPGNDPLLYSSWKDFLPKYHTGGIASGNGSLKQNEVLSILEDGEMILDDQKQKSLYRFVDFATYFSEKFGKVITNMDLAGLIPTIRSNRTLPNTAPVGNVNSNTSVHFGDVYISGASEETVAKHREVNRQFANEVLKHLNIKR